MTDISVVNIKKAFEEDKVILDGLSFDITAGEKVGLLGKNGAGKTTLFRLIAREIEEDEGDIAIPAGKRVGLVSQIPHYPEGFTGEDVLRSAQERVYALGREMESLQKQMAHDESRSLLSRYDAVSAEFERLGGYELERFRNEVAGGLGIPQREREQPFDTLSGGEKTRLNLARLILEDTDILLLDEPTNHLDMKSSEWLEDYLRKFRGTVLVISHDRWFLDHVVDRIVEIVDGKAEFYKGNYTFYAAEKERRYQEKLRQYEKDQAKIAQLQAAADRLHLWAFMGNDALHKRAFSMEKRIERLSQTEKPKTERKMTTRFGQREFRGDEVLWLRGVEKSFGDRKLFSIPELRVAGGERIALLGDNGTGKTTLIKMILGEEKADTGIIRLGPSIKAAYLPQIIQFDDPWRNLIDTLIYADNCTVGEARSRLGAFKFSGEDAFKLVGELSGGKMCRLRLCMLMKKEVNLLILDEPTNHLDIASREWIEEAVEDFEGALLFVSHDRYFVQRFAQRIWELEDGRIRDFAGTYSDLRRQKEIEAELKSAAPKAVPEKKKAPPPPTGSRALSPLARKRRLERLEADIAKKEEALAKLEAACEENATDYQKLMALEEAMSEWERLSDEIEREENREGS